MSDSKHINMTRKKLFLIGPGFIGGSLLVRLRQARPDLDLSALTRRNDQADELRELGIEPIIGGLANAEIIKKNVELSDIVIHTATADDVPSALAVVEGITQRADKTRRIIYIHTSGNDELAHSAKSLVGASIEARTLSDAQGDEVLENGRIQPDAMHRQVDGPLREHLFNQDAEKKHNASTAIMMPPLIYGVGSKPWERISIQIPLLARTMIAKGLFTLPHGFDGAWNSVWVHDLVETYLVLLEELEGHTPGQPQPSHYLFPAEPAVVPWKDVFDAVVETLKKHGVHGDVRVIDDRKTFEALIAESVPDYASAYGQIVFGKDNSYTRPDRLHARGFKHSSKGPVDSILKGGELDLLVRKELASAK
ncbi:hypothetical protein HKX48_002937 [Thoreauomyces humboldtii]|nr:hypothetical protein HKX48_002937 [Thoreauomyces humboldtii]